MENFDKNNEQYIIIENPMGMQFKIACANPEADYLKAVIDTMLKGPIPEEIYINSAIKLTEECCRAFSARKNTKKIRDVFIFSSDDNFDIQNLLNNLKLPKVDEYRTSDGEKLLLIDSQKNGDGGEDSLLNQTRMLLQNQKISIYRNISNVLKKINDNSRFFDLYDLIMIVAQSNASINDAKEFFASVSRCVSKEKIFFVGDIENQEIKNSIMDACVKALIPDPEYWLSEHLLNNFEIIESLDRTEIGAEAVFDCFRYEYSADKIPVLESLYREKISQLISCENFDQNCSQNLKDIRSMFENEIYDFLVRSRIVATNYPHLKYDGTFVVDKNTCKTKNGGNSVSGLAQRMITMAKESMAQKGDDAYNNWQEFISNHKKYPQRTPLLFQEQHGYLLRLIYNYLSNITHANSSATFINNTNTFLTLKFAILDCMAWLSKCMASCQDVVTRRS